MTSAELLRSVSTEELREAARHMESEQRNGSVYALAAAGLSLIAEGRENGTFEEARIPDPTLCGPIKHALLRTLAGGDR